MYIDLSRFVPLLLVAVGYTLKRTGVLKREIADSLIKLVFYVLLPATIFYSISGLELSARLLILPVAGFVIALACYVFGYLVKGFLGMEKGTEGTFLIASGATNQGLFAYPFFLLFLGTEGLSYVAFYDFGQVTLALTLGYVIALRYSGKRLGFSRIAGEIMSLPLIWAFVLSLGMNYFGLYHLTTPVMPLIEMLHNATTPVIMISLGIFLEPGVKKKKVMAASLFTRFVYALIAAYVFISILDLQGLERLTVLIASPLPPAMITLVYSVKEGLDTEYASALISVCVLIGLLYTPLLFTLLL